MNMKEKIIKAIQERVYVTREQLAEALGYRIEEMEQPVQELLDSHELGVSRQGRLALASAMGLFKGKLEVKQRGFAFLRTGGDVKDIFIGAKERNGALNGEEVLVRLKRRRGQGENPEGEVVKILSVSDVTLVGTVRKTKKGIGILSDDGDITDMFVNPANSMKAKNGQKVVVKLLRRSQKGRSAEGEIIEILGKADAPGVDVLSYARRYGLNAAFGEKAEREAARSKRLPLDLSSRRDLCEKLIITIDGADAKDLDDAVSLEKLDNGNWLLGVHIADVSHYVCENGALDREALDRGTSAYLVNSVVPMLPAVLSNDLCSLNPDEEKLTLSCLMEVNEKGSLVTYEIVNTVIKTRYRMTYDVVNGILGGDANMRNAYAEIIGMLTDMNELAKKMRKRRFARGSIDFDLPEPEIRVDGKGIPTYIGVRTRGDAEKLIEEFMLKANITVAQHMYHMELPFIYRIHEQPDADKMRELSTFLSNFGIKLKGRDDIQPKAIQTVLNKVEGMPESNIVNSVTLRSLKKARYDVSPVAHFGLAADQYCHFTSPIRRYPDLIVHRIIKTTLAAGMDERSREHYEAALPGIAKQSSERERNAIEAERAVNDLKMAEYMQRHIGEVFEGVVSGVTKFGIFVELENTIEGMIPLAQMNDDYYEYYEKMYCMIGKRTKKRITLGDKAEIKVVYANVAEGKIEFEFNR